MVPRFAAAFLATILALGSASARADCLPLAEFARQLAAKYQEAPIARAIQGRIPIIVFASPNGATYTIVAVVQSGRTACMIAAGTSWQLAPVKLAGDPS